MHQIVTHFYISLFDKPAHCFNHFSNFHFHQSGVHHAMNPDPYRGAFGSDGLKYAKDVQDLIDYGTWGHVAGFISEAIQVYFLNMPFPFCCFPYLLVRIVACSSLIRTLAYFFDRAWVELWNWHLDTCLLHTRT